MSEILKNKEHLGIGHASLEEEIKILSKEVQRKTTSVEKAESDQVKEVIKDSLRRIHGDYGLGNSVLPSYLENIAPELKLKIEKMADRVFHDGLKKTLSEAKKEGPFFLDALHDILSDKLYEEMKSRGLI